MSENNTGWVAVKCLIEYYPFICYTRGYTYPSKKQFKVDFPYERVELYNQVAWMFKEPEHMRTFKRQFVTIDNQIVNSAPSSPHEGRELPPRYLTR